MRASSGMIGTMRVTDALVTQQVAEEAENAVVVEADTLSPVPARISEYASGGGMRNGATRTTRSGSGPLSTLRRAIMYSNSGESLPGCQYGGSPSSSS